jgi:hypothetical protein
MIDAQVNAEELAERGTGRKQEAARRYSECGGLWHASHAGK